MALAGHAGFCWEEADREELQAVGTLLGGPEEGECIEEPRGGRIDRTDRYVGLPGKEAREDSRRGGLFLLLQDSSNSQSQKSRNLIKAVGVLFLLLFWGHSE